MRFMRSLGELLERDDPRWPEVQTWIAEATNLIEVLPPSEDRAAALLATQVTTRSPMGAIIYTDISRDGMLQGANIEAMGEMANASPVPVIASGGVTTVEDVRILAQAGLSACIIGRSLYEGKISLADAHEAARGS